MLEYIVFHINDFVDILLVALLLYGLYYILKGTSAISIFVGIVLFILLSRVVKAMNMRMLSAILGSFMSVGFIALIVLFQQEIRQFLLVLGKSIKGSRVHRLMLMRNDSIDNVLNYNVLKHVSYRFAQSKTGAIIVMTRKNKLEEIIATGEIINADMSDRLLENLFFKNSPLHDGAVIITKNKIISAGCILPVSSNLSLPQEYGLRHRAAIGLTEQTDAVTIIVSEERGTVSIAVDGKVYNNVEQGRFVELVNDLFPDAI